MIRLEAGGWVPAPVVRAAPPATPAGHRADRRADRLVARVLGGRAALAVEDVRRRADGEQSFDAGAVPLEGSKVEGRLHFVIRGVDVDAVGLEKQLERVEVALAGGPTDGRGPEIAAVIHVAAVPQVGNAVRGPAVGRPN